MLRACIQLTVLEKKRMYSMAMPRAACRHLVVLVYVHGQITALPLSII